MDLDDGGIYRLLAGIVTQARKDARRGDLQAYSFIEYMKRGNMDDLFGSMEKETPPAALSDAAAANDAEYTTQQFDADDVQIGMWLKSLDGDA